MEFEGLFYLVSGISSYVILACFLRVLSSKEDSKQKNTLSEIENSWSSLEELEILDILEETGDIKTFRFKRKNGGKIKEVKPGQFLSFQIRDNEKTLRSYSISSSCENYNIIQVSIKKIENGVGSNWFHSLKVGDFVLAHPPSGLFTDNELQEEVRIFIAGGIGITPFVSMVETAFDRGQKHLIYLFYSVRSKKDLAFHDVLTSLEKRFQNFPIIQLFLMEKIGMGCQAELMENWFVLKY